MHVICLVTFWFSLAVIAYTYVGYGLLMAWFARWRPRLTRTADITPSVTVLVAAYNEAEWIGSKIENTLALDYPSEMLEVLVVTDGSDDGSDAIVARYAAQYPNVRLTHQPERRGKAHALGRASPLATGEILVFSDANSLFAPDILRQVVRHFADPEVGGVGGAKRMLGAASQATAGAPEEGESLYWRYESFLKACDSAVSSVMGVPGEVWAARRSAYRPAEPDVILEDFVASLRLVEAGWRVVLEPRALAYEAASPGLAAEWERRVRNAAGGWQAFFRLPGLLRHPNPWVPFQYLSHRILRWIVTPALFPLLLASNVCLGAYDGASPLYAVVLAGQTLFYLSAGLGWLTSRRGRPIKALVAPFYIVLLNAAALVGGWRFLRGRQGVIWKKVR